MIFIDNARFKIKSDIYPFALLFSFRVTFISNNIIWFISRLGCVLN